MPLLTRTTKRTLSCNGHQNVTNSCPGNGTKLLGPFGIEANNIKTSHRNVALTLVNPEGRSLDSKELH